MAKNVTTDFSTNNLDATGATDNTAKLNAILAGGSQTLYWPAGTYLFTATPTTLPAGMVWYGDGPYQTIFNSTRTVTNSSVGVSLADNCTIRDMQFTTTNDANAVLYALASGTTTGVVVARCFFQNFAAGGIRSSGVTTRARIVDSEFTNMVYVTSASCITGCFQDSIITGCFFHDNNGTLTTQHCIYLNGSPVPRDVIISNCVFENYTGGAAVALQGDEISVSSGAIIVQGCTFYGTGLPGVIGTTIQGLRVQSCAFSTNATGSQPGVVLYACNGFAITDNVFNAISSGASAAGGGCIQIDNATAYGTTSGTIAGNVMWSGDPTTGDTTLRMGNGITLYGGKNILITDNIISGWAYGVVFNGTGNVSNITVRNNQITAPASPTWIDNGGGVYLFGNPKTSAAFAFDGPVTNVKLLDNVCSGQTYELLFTQYTYTGQTSNGFFRSASWAQGATGYQKGAQPVAFSVAPQQSVLTGGPGPAQFSAVTE